MLKPDLVTAVSKATGYTKQDSESCIDAVIKVIADTLAKGETVKIANLGEWFIVEKAPHIGENPKTKEKVEIPQKSIVRYKISNNLKNILN